MPVVMAAQCAKRISVRGYEAEGTGDRCRSESQGAERTQPLARAWGTCPAHPPQTGLGLRPRATVREPNCVRAG
jgi:hypothetical protein